MSWWTGRPSRRDLEVELGGTRREVIDLRAALDAQGELLREAELKIAEWQAWGAEAKADLDAWDKHRCAPAPEPTVLDVTRVEDVLDAEVVEDHPDLPAFDPDRLFRTAGGEDLPQADPRWMRSGVTSHWRKDDLKAIAAEGERRRLAALIPASEFDINSPERLS